MILIIFHYLLLQKLSTCKNYFTFDFDYIPSFIIAETVTRVNGTEVAQPVASPNLHDLQIYGIVVTIILCFIVFGGVKMINRVAPAFLVPVLFSLFCIFAGMLLAKKDHPAGSDLYTFFSLLFLTFEVLFGLI